METSVNNKCKAFTSLEQSKKLAEFLPHESADCYWEDDMSVEFGHGWHSQHIPCWSLAALLEQLPYEVCDDDGNSSYLKINKEKDMCHLEYTDPYEDFESIETNMYEHFVDACYEMILKLYKLNLL